MMNRKQLILCLIFVVVGVVFGIEKITDKGYAALASFNGSLKDGVILSKPGLFEFAVRNGAYHLSVMDEQGKCAANLQTKVVSTKGKIAVAIQLERILEQAQGRDGYRVVLFLDGKRMIEKECTPYRPAAKLSKLVPGDGHASDITGLQEFPKSQTPDAIRRQAGISISAEWKPSQENLLLDTSAMTVSFVKGRGQGNPLCGVYNKMTGSLMLSAGGLGWEMQYRDAQGISYRIDADGCSYREVECHKTADGGRFVMRWTSELFEEVAIYGEIKGARLETRLSLKGFSKNAFLESISYPCWRFVKMPGKDTLLYPSFSGLEKANPTSGFYHTAPWPNGQATMQFAALYNDRKCGIYIGHEDRSGEINQQVFIGSAGLFEASWRHSVPRGTQTQSLPGLGVLELYRGRWFEAGQIYKRFAATAPWWIKEIPRRDTPKWLMENPFWIQGIPLSDNTVETYRYVQEFMEVPVAFVCGLLENTNGPWRFGPNFRVKQSVKEPMKRLRGQKTIHLEPYYNCRLWYAGPGADKENGYQTSGKPNAVLDENGMPHIGMYSNGLHAVMCPAAPAWQKKLYDTIAGMAAQGVDAIYHDQLPCSSPFVCASTEHNHKPMAADGWLKCGHWQTYGKVMTELRRQYPDLAHTGEDASDAFLNCLDGFMVWRFGRSGHVPVFQSVYAPRIQFVGRGGDGNAIAGTYESFFPRMAEQLVYGEQIGWLGLDDIRIPSPRRNYLKKLSTLRYALASYLNSSEMAAPLQFASPVPQMTTQWGVDEVNICTTDRVLHGCWRHVSGSHLVIFVNTTDKAETISPILDCQGKTLTIFRETSEAPLEVKQVPQQLTLGAYACELWLIGDKIDTAFASRLHQAVRKGYAVMNGGDRGLLIPSKTNFKQDFMLNAIRQELRARDASWMILANRTDNATLGYHPNPRRTMHGNWINAQDGAIIYFGAVFFGDKATALTCTAATDCDNVVLELIDITPNSPNFVLAEIKLQRGGWYEYKTYHAKLLRAITGRRNVIFRVKGGSCNFKSWKAK